MNAKAKEMVTQSNSRRRFVAVIAAGILGLVVVAWVFRDEFEVKSLSGPVAITKGEDAPNRGVLGARFDESLAAATISEVLAGSAAADAGLMPGDVLVAIDSNSVADVAEVAKTIAATSPGDEIAIRFQRGLETKDVRIKLKGVNETISQPLSVPSEP